MEAHRNLETQLVLNGSGEAVHLGMDGLQRFVIGGQLLLDGFIDLRLAIEKIPQGRLVRIERIQITVTSLVVLAWLIPPLTSLWTKPVVVVPIEVHSFLLGFWAVVARMSNIPADLACHASF